MRLLALAWLLTTAALTTYAPPPLRVLETPTREEIDACAATMCEGFWTTSQLTPAQVAALHKTQSDDFRTRFSGKRRLRGSLLVVPDDDEGVANPIAAEAEAPAPAGEPPTPAWRPSETGVELNRWPSADGERKPRAKVAPILLDKKDGGGDGDDCGKVCCVVA